MFAVDSKTVFALSFEEASFPLDKIFNSKRASPASSKIGSTPLSLS
jgi:hypothetical protein|tara:strand:+ start:406 stop:543 length:138 start_codon:yes stop_codon:yes gene_type:complete